MATAIEKSKNSVSKRSFHQELVLNRWMWRFFKGNGLGALEPKLSGQEHEGIDEDGQTKFLGLK